MNPVVSVTLPALSVVAPWGERISAGIKTIEVRSWRPIQLPIDDLLIVENQRRLTRAGDTDADGRAVAVVRIAEVHVWSIEEAEAACSTWETGWFAWVIENVRPIDPPFQVLAARKIYNVTVVPKLTQRLKLSCD